MMKIALYIPSLNAGGAEKVIALLSTHLADNESYTVYLIVNSLDGVYWHLISEKINVVNLNTNRVLKSILPLAKWIKSNKPDVLISALNYANIASSISVFLSGQKCKVILTEHGLLSLNSDIRNKLFKKALKYSHDRADYVVAVSKGLKSNIQEVLKTESSKVVVINNPISSELHTISRIDVDKYFSFTPSSLIVSIGRLEHIKNYPVLIESFKKLNRKDLALVILGEGSQREELENIITSYHLEKNIILPGFTHETFAWLNRADIFVSSSNSESFGNAVVEAMMHGVNIVSTNCHGPREILDGGRYGILVPINDSDKMAESIDLLLKKPNIFSKSDIINRAKSYSPSNIFKQYIQIIDS